MEPGKKTFIWICTACAMFLTLAIVDLVSKYNQLQKLETMEISTEPDAVGRFNKNEYDTFISSSDGTATSTPYFVGISLMEAPNRIVGVNKCCAIDFHRGDSIWVVKGYPFSYRPSADDVRMMMIKVLREQIPGWLRCSMLLVMFGIIIWGSKKIFL